MSGDSFKSLKNNGKNGFDYVEDDALDNHDKEEWRRPRKKNRRSKPAHKKWDD